MEQMRQIAVEGDLAQADDDADASEGVDLGGEVAGAVANLLRERLVAGRGASNDGADPGMAELEAVISGDGAVFGGEAEVVEDGVHEVAGAVTGEGAAGAVGPWAPGARPRMRMRARGSPKPGTGLAQ